MSELLELSAKTTFLILSTGTSRAEFLVQVKAVRVMTASWHAGAPLHLWRFPVKLMTTKMTDDVSYHTAFKARTGSTDTNNVYVNPVDGII